MPLWKKEDSVAGTPTFLDSDTAFFVDEAEATVASNRAKGFKTPGWYTYTLDANGRHRAECIVAMTDTTGAGDAADDATVADPS